MDLIKEFEKTGYASWINSDLYPDGKIYTKEYTEWLEKRLKAINYSQCCKSDSEQCKHDKDPIKDSNGFEVCPDCGEWGENC